MITFNNSSSCSCCSSCSSSNNIININNNNRVMSNQGSGMCINVNGWFGGMGTDIFQVNYCHDYYDYDYQRRARAPTSRSTRAHRRIPPTSGRSPSPGTGRSWAQSPDCRWRLRAGPLRTGSRSIQTSWRRRRTSSGSSSPTVPLPLVLYLSIYLSI